MERVDLLGVAGEEQDEEGVADDALNDSLVTAYMTASDSLPRWPRS